MENQNGTTDIPALTTEAEHLSTLSTLKEIRDTWKPTSRPFTFLTTFPSTPMPITKLPRKILK